MSAGAKPCVALCVDPDRIEDIWPHARAFIEAAFDGERGDDDAEAMFADLVARKSLLWIAWDDERKKILAAATTKLIKVSRGLVCWVTSCGGNDLKRWRDCLGVIEGYAKAEGCSHVRLSGREGWKVIFPDYRKTWVTLEKAL
jgi:hypothetical protein